VLKWYEIAKRLGIPALMEIEASHGSSGATASVFPPDLVPFFAFHLVFQWFFIAI